MKLGDLLFDHVSQEYRAGGPLAILAETVQAQSFLIDFVVHQRLRGTSKLTGGTQNSVTDSSNSEPGNHREERNKWWGPAEGGAATVYAGSDLDLLELNCVLAGAVRLLARAVILIAKRVDLDCRGMVYGKDGKVFSVIISFSSSL